MYEILQKAHSGIAYLALLFLVIAAANALMGYTAKRTFLPKDKTLALVALITCHLQLVLGLVLYFVSPVGFAALGQMSNAGLRLTALEHPLINLLAIVLITIGWSKHKKEESNNGKFSKIALFYFLGLVLLLTRIPWGLWLG